MTKDATVIEMGGLVSLLGQTRDAWLHLVGRVPGGACTKYLVDRGAWSFIRDSLTSHFANTFYFADQRDQGR